MDCIGEIVLKHGGNVFLDAKVSGILGDNQNEYNYLWKVSLTENYKKTRFATPSVSDDDLQ